MPVSRASSRPQASLIAFFRVRLVTARADWLKTRSCRLACASTCPSAASTRREPREALAESLIAGASGRELERHAQRASRPSRARNRARRGASHAQRRARAQRLPMLRRAGPTAGASGPLRQPGVEAEMGGRGTPRYHPTRKRGAQRSARGRPSVRLAHDPELVMLLILMLAGLSGSLVSHHFAERILPQEFSGRLGEAALGAAEQSVAAVVAHPGLPARAGIEHPSPSGRWLPLRLSSSLASASARQMATEPDTRHALLIGSSGRVALVAATWNVSLDNLWRDAARRGIGLDAAWVLCTNGRELRLVDTQRTYSRAYLQFDLRADAGHPPTFASLVGCVCVTEAFRRCDRRASARSRSDPVVCAARPGCQPIAAHRRHRVGSASARRPQQMRRGTTSRDCFDESLTVVYRVLFLMFAESRSLVPNWHPIYRESYTVESLRERAERPGQVPGLWEALQAIARLAHKGCRAGSLVVPPFNGRLFSPARSPIAESCAVDDEVARQALLALSTASGPDAKRGTDALSASDAHRLSRPRSRTTRCGVRERARLRARIRRLEAGTRFCFGEAETRESRPDRSTRRRRSPISSCGARCIRWSTARRPIAFFGFASWTRRWAAPPFSSRRAVILRAHTSGRCSRRHVRRSGTSTKRTARVQASRRAAMPVRRRSQFHGGATGAAVAVAGDVVGQQATDVSRSPPRVRQQSASARRPSIMAVSRLAPAAAARSPRGNAALRRCRPRALARAGRRRAPMACRDARRHSRCRPGKGAAARGSA